MQEIDTVYVSGRSFIRQKYAENPAAAQSAPLMCVEGVGDYGGILYTGWEYLLGNPETVVGFVSCEENGQVIFDADCFLREGTTSVSPVHAEGSSTNSEFNAEGSFANSTYNVNGSRVMRSNKSEVNVASGLPRGVYIQNGRKFVMR